MLRMLRCVLVDETAWRQAIRQQLELELDSRVKEALASPTQQSVCDEGQESQRSKRIGRRRAAQLCREMFDRSNEEQEQEQVYLAGRRWNVGLLLTEQQ